jgi:hypothetical protein
MDWLKIKALEYGFALIVAPAAFYLIQNLKKYVAWVDQLSAWKKRSFVVVTVTVLTILGQVTGVDFGVTEASFSNVAELDVEAVKVVLASGFAMAIHAIKQGLAAKKDAKK